MELLWIYLAGINVAAFTMYGIDKSRAMRGRWRIPENTLLGVVVLGGGLGALAGMQVFRHKTRKPKFRVGVPVILLAEVVALYLLLK